jgi:hypothetical protein
MVRTDKKPAALAPGTQAAGARPTILPRYPGGVRVDPQASGLRTRRSRH